MIRAADILSADALDACIGMADALKAKCDAAPKVPASMSSQLKKLRNELAQLQAKVHQNGASNETLGQKLSRNVSGTEYYKRKLAEVEELASEIRLKYGENL